MEKLTILISTKNPLNLLNLLFFLKNPSVSVKNMTSITEIAHDMWMGRQTQNIKPRLKKQQVCNNKKKD
jgi:hypothetical protein